MKPAIVTIALAILAAGSLRADLAQVNAEPNLEKRSKLALDHADQALKDARASYQKGDLQQVSALIAELQESVELAQTCLKETGKNPRKSPKWFKRAEIVTRDLLRKLDAFQQEMSVTDRSTVDSAKARVQQIHDELLVGLMEGKRK